MPSDSTNPLDQSAVNPRDLIFSVDLLSANSRHSALFSTQAKSVLSNRSYDMVHQYLEYVGPAGLQEFWRAYSLLKKLDIKSLVDIDSFYKRNFDLVRPVAIATSVDKIDDAIAKIAECINDLADKNFLKVSLNGLTLVELLNVSPTGHAVDPVDKRYAVVSYVSITDEGYKYATQHYSFVDTLPTVRIEDLI